MDLSLNRQTIAAIVARLQEQVVGHRVLYSGGSLWVGDWEAVPEVEKALQDFRDHEEDPIPVAVGIVIDALLERDPGASQPPVQRKTLPPGVAPPGEGE